VQLAPIAPRIRIRILGLLVWVTILLQVTPMYLTLLQLEAWVHLVREVVGAGVRRTRIRKTRTNLRRTATERIRAERTVSKK
jgi:hypothetical protein